MWKQAVLGFKHMTYGSESECATHYAIAHHKYWPQCKHNAISFNDNLWHSKHYESHNSLWSQSLFMNIISGKLQFIILLVYLKMTCKRVIIELTAKVRASTELVIGDKTRVSWLAIDVCPTTFWLLKCETLACESSTLVIDWDFKLHLLVAFRGKCTTGCGIILCTESNVSPTLCKMRKRVNSERSSQY